MSEQTIIPRDPVPMHLWGKDHWSTFAYAASVATTGRREIDKDKMRTDYGRHPHGGGRVNHMLGHGPGDKEYPTRLRDGIEIRDHDDWDCLDDAVAAGLLTWGTWVNPFVVLTNVGLQAWTQVQAYENDPAVKSWTQAMIGWTPTPEDSGLAETGDAIWNALAV